MEANLPLEVVKLLRAFGYILTEKPDSNDVSSANDHLNSDGSATTGDFKKSYSNFSHLLSQDT